MPLAIPPYDPHRRHAPAEIEELRKKLAEAEAKIARQRKDIIDLIANGEVVCDALEKLARLNRDHAALAPISEMRAAFKTYTPKP